MAAVPPVSSPGASLDLAGKSAVITGASRGIGAEIARVLAARGANVAICYVSEASTVAAEALATELRRHAVKTTCVREDLSIEGVGERVMSKAADGLGTTTIDILVNNAAYDSPDPSPAHLTAPGLFDKFMQVNAKAPLELVSALVPRLPAQGGRIISISSVLARRPDVPFAAWAASKAALECLTRFWAAELGAEFHLTSNAVAIGPTMTDYHANDPPELLQELAQLPTAAKRMAYPSDVAPIVAFLASDAGRWINGDVLQGNGGMHFN